MKLLSNCNDCPLKGSKIILGEGSLESSIMLIGEGAGIEEEQYGRPFIGPSGRILQEILEKFKIQRKDLYITNVVKCRPKSPHKGKQNRAPVKQEIECCKPLLDEELSNIKSSIIIPLGNVALKAVGISEKIMSVRGDIFKDIIPGKIIIPTLHPAAVLRRPELKKLIEKDFEKISSLIHNHSKVDLPSCSYKVTLKLGDVLEMKESLLKSEAFAFDIETTSNDFLKDRIICISFSNKEREGWCLPLLKEEGSSFWKENDCLTVLDSIKEILESNVKKIAHNGSFDIKFLQKAGFIINNYYFDTILSHHLLDSKSEHGLKILASIYTDMGNYDKVLDPYIQKARKEGNYLTIPLPILWEYNAKDSDATFRLYTIFSSKMKEENLEKLFYKFQTNCSKKLQKHVKFKQYTICYSEYQRIKNHTKQCFKFFEIMPFKFCNLLQL
jgi:DNA polymerase